MSYEMIDHFLRNNLDDEDYAEYSAALDSICALPAPDTQNDFKPDYDAIQELLEEISRLWDIIIDLEEQLRNKNDIA